MKLKSTPIKLMEVMRILRASVCVSKLMRQIKTLLRTNRLNTAKPLTNRWSIKNKIELMCTHNNTESGGDEGTRRRKTTTITLQIFITHAPIFHTSVLCINVVRTWTIFILNWDNTEIGREIRLSQRMSSGVHAIRTVINDVISFLSMNRYGHVTVMRSLIPVSLWS